MLFVCYTPKFPENPEPNRTNRDLGRSCSVSSRSIGCSSPFGLGLGREVKNLIGIGLNPRTDTEHRAVSVHSQACRPLTLAARRSRSSFQKFGGGSTPPFNNSSMCSKRTSRHNSISH